MAVVEGIPVADSSVAIAQDRIDTEYETDQLAEESQYAPEIYAEERDGGGHGHDHDHAHAHEFG